MSEITHSDELVTKTDLSNFYQTILPYLGGMPDILANKFSKSNMYSTDEKIVGTWIDGKPIYQKTIVDTTPNGTTGTLSTKYINIGASIDYGTIVDCNIQNGSESFSAMYMDNNKENILKAVINNNTNASHPNTIAIIVSRWFNVPCYVTIQYTKTTDSSVAIGVDTDYSTTEKIVGTWIDGTPIYQKTYTGTASFNNWVADISSLPSGCNLITNIFGIVKNTNGNVLTCNQSELIAYYEASAQKILLLVTSQNGAYLNCTYYITIQYTKTS